MAFIILSSTERELNRIELKNSPMVIGRSPECEITVHDILLSRRHCRLTPTSDGWLVIDLQSRNGTSVGGRKIEQRRLKDGDVVVLGKTRVTFRTAEFMPDPRPLQRPAIPTPVDPGETMSGTVYALEYTEPTLPVAHRRVDRMPSPKPRPRDPEAFESDNVYSMLEQIASSSWDSIYAVNAQPLRRDRPLPRPRLPAKNADRSSLPRASHAGPKISLALQVTTPPRRSPVIASPPPVARRAISATTLIRKRLSRVTRWVGRVRHLRLF